MHVWQPGITATHKQAQLYVYIDGPYMDRQLSKQMFKTYLCVHAAHIQSDDGTCHHVTIYAAVTSRSVSQTDIIIRL